MTKQELDEIIKDINEDPESYCQLRGLNPNAITKFVIELSKQPIDFNILPMHWICMNAIKWSINEDAVDLTVSECMVSEVEFEEICSNDFHVYNPLIYMFIKEAAEKVDENLITLEAKLAYYKRKLEEAEKKFESSLDDNIQSEIDYYSELIEKLTNKTK